MMKVFLRSSLLFVLMISLFSCNEDNIINNIIECDSLEWNKNIAKTAVHNHAVMLSNILSDVESEEQQIQFIQESIEGIRFYSDSSGYFYVYNYDCVCVAHATQKDIVGKDLYDHQDTHGNYVIRNLAAAALNGGGFVEFYWLKPGTTGEHEKLGYVEPIIGTNFFIGSGVYLQE
jgi:signal transduction histidine kinase